MLNAWKRTWTSEIGLVLWQCFRCSELLEGRAHSRSPFDFAPTARRGRQGRLSATLPRRAGAGGMTKLRAVAHLGMSGAGWTELLGVVRGKGAQQVPVRLRSHGTPGQAGQALGYAPTARRGRRDDKVEGGGPPWHEWRWMVDGQSCRELLEGRAHSRSPFDFAPTARRGRQGRLSATLPRRAGAGGMTKGRAVTHLGMSGGGWTESKKS